MFKKSWKKKFDEAYENVKYTREYYLKLLEKFPDSEYKETYAAQLITIEGLLKTMDQIKNS